MNINNKKKIIISIVLIVFLIIGFIIFLLTDNSYENLNLDELVIEEESEKFNNIGDNEDSNNTSSQNNINGNNKYNQNAINENASNVFQEETEKIAIHVTGEVKKEGLIYLPLGSRVADAIKEAGGETKNADLSQINLAYQLQDGQKLYIPNKNEIISEYIISATGNTESEGSSSNNLKGENKVNINTATQSELDQLPGIGPSIAQRIIDYREENGNFQKIEDVQNVKGIGDAKYEEIKDKITVWNLAVPALSTLT